MTNPGQDPADGGLMNIALRMVIPMRREFGRALDVQHFLHDFAYAQEVLTEARTSQNPKLREYAQYLDGKLLGPRNASAPAPAVSERIASLTADAPTASKSETAQTEQQTDDEARQLMLAKYRSGLR